MGAVMAIPLLGSIAGLGGTALTACVSGGAFFCTSSAVSLFFGAVVRSAGCCGGG